MTSPALLCYVTDRLAGGERPLLSLIRAAIDAGIDLVQIREKDLGTRALIELAAAAVASARGSATRVVINDRLDVALAAGVHGVHLSGQSMPAATVRSQVPRDFRIGVSCHSVEDVCAAEQARADYAVLGPIFETAAKVRYGPPLGLDALRDAVRARQRMPVLALGGITVDRARECIAAGAAGIAGISIFQDCDSIGDRVKALRNEFAVFAGG